MKGINFRFEQNHPSNYRLQERAVPVAGYADEIPF